MRMVLKPYELEMAAGVGVRRHINGMAKGMVHTGGFNGINGWERDIHGACGELAAAKALNLLWDGSFGVLRTPDLVHPIEGTIHVRTTMRPDGYLVHRPNETQEGIYLLITCDPNELARVPAYEVRGWLPGGEFRQHQDWWAEPRNADGSQRPGAWFAPQASLRPIESLLLGKVKVEA